MQSDWLSLWGLNVNLDTFDPPPGTEVLVGRMYVVQKGDTLLSIAREFGVCVCVCVCIARGLDLCMCASCPSLCV